MASNAGHLNYDANLLESAPAATKAQLQSGYNPDLLTEKQTPPPSRQGHLTPSRAPSKPPAPERDLESESPPPKQPFYRTTKGLIIIVVAAIVIIAAVVGGAVGGSKKKKSINVITIPGQGDGQSAAPSSASASSSGAGQGVGSPILTPSGTASGKAMSTIGTLNPNPTPGSNSSQIVDVNQDIGFLNGSG